MKIRFAPIFIALCAVFTWAHGQNEPKNASAKSADACKAAADLINTDFFGVWILQLDAAGSLQAQTTRLVFKRNPEFSESLAGEFDGQGQRIEVFGDVEAGSLELEESNNGKDISGLWKGRVAEGSCGQAIAGTRRILATQTEQPFVLRRAGW
jgi:hypothetical protein